MQNKEKHFTFCTCFVGIGCRNAISLILHFLLQLFYHCYPTKYTADASDISEVWCLSCLSPAGAEARRVFDDAQRLLHRMIDNCDLKGRGLVGFWRAQSDGDDINIYEGDVTPHRDVQPSCVFHGLRQQVRDVIQAMVPLKKVCYCRITEKSQTREGILIPASSPQSFGRRSLLCVGFHTEESIQTVDRWHNIHCNIVFYLNAIILITQHKKWTKQSCVRTQQPFYVWTLTHTLIGW